MTVQQLNNFVARHFSELIVADNHHSCMCCPFVAVISGIFPCWRSRNLKFKSERSMEPSICNKGKQNHTSCYQRIQIFCKMNSTFYSILKNWSSKYNFSLLIFPNYLYMTMIYSSYTNNMILIIPHNKMIICCCILGEWCQWTRATEVTEIINTWMDSAEVVCLKSVSRKECYSHNNRTTATTRVNCRTVIQPC